MLKFQLHYFLFAIILFIIEVFIALFIHDEIIRPHVGDVLVVILIYCFLKSILKVSVLTAAISTLMFSYAVEILQYFKMVEKLGMQNSRLARIIIGTSFSWIDIFAYTLGIGLVLLLEKIIPHNGEKNLTKAS